MSSDAPINGPEQFVPDFTKFSKVEQKSLQEEIDKQYKKAFPPSEPPEKFYPVPINYPETLNDGKYNMLKRIKGFNERKVKGLGTESERKKIVQELTALLKQLAISVSKVGTAWLLADALARMASADESVSLKTVAAPIIEPPEISAVVDSRTAAVIAETKAVMENNKQVGGVFLATVGTVSERPSLFKIKPQEIVRGVPVKYFDAAMFAQEKTGIPRSVILGIFRQESSMGTNPNLDKSPDLGPAQIRPATWATVSERVGKATGEKPNPNNPKHAALAAALVLKDSGFTKDGQKAIRTYHRGTGHWQDNLGKDYFEKIVGYAVPFEEALQNSGF